MIKISLYTPRSRKSWKNKRFTTSPLQNCCDLVSLES